MSRARKGRRAPPARSATPTRPARDWLPGVERGAALLLTGLALAYAAAFLLHAGALWRDEVNSADFAAMPSLSSIWGSLRYDSFPILPSLLLRGWGALGLGQGDAGLRLFGLLTGIAFLGALWVAGRSLGSPAPVLALALAGLNPWVVRGVGSIRPYGPGVVFIILTLALLWRAVMSPTPRRFLLAGVVAVLAVQCMYQNAFLLLAICLGAGVAALRASRPAALVGVAAVGVAAAVSLLPYAPSVAASRSWSLVAQMPATWGLILRPLSEAIGSVGATMTWLWLALALLACAGGILALWERSGAKAAGKEPAPALFGAVVLAVGTLLYLGAIKAAHLRSQPWYYVPLLAAAAPALEAGARAAAAGRPGRMGALAVSLLIAIATVSPAWRQVAERRTDVDAVAAHLERTASPGDVIVVFPFYSGVSFQRYYRGPVPWVTIPPLDDLRIHRYDLLKEAMIRSAAMDPVLDRMAESLRAGHRVWLVGGLPALQGAQPPAPLPPAPNPATGWQNGPYLLAWGQQANYFLASHARRSDRVPIPGEASASSYERVSLFVVSGWR